MAFWITVQATTLPHYITLSLPAKNVVNIKSWKMQSYFNLILSNPLVFKPRNFVIIQQNYAFIQIELDRNTAPMLRGRCLQHQLHNHCVIYLFHQCAVVYVFRFYKYDLCNCAAVECFLERTNFMPFSPESRNPFIPVFVSWSYLPF